MRQKLSKQFPVLGKLSRWFYGLSQRDQSALKWLSLALLLFLTYAFVWQPVQQNLERSKAAREQAYTNLVWMKENELRARQLAKQQPSAAVSNPLSGKSLLSVVSSTAQKFKVELQRFEPRGEAKVNVWLDNVSFNQMMLWISELNTTHSIRIEQITVEKSEQPGRVSARMAFLI